MKVLNERDTLFITETAFSPINGEALEHELEAHVARLHADAADLEQRLAASDNDKNLSDAGKNARTTELYAEKAAFLDAAEAEFTKNISDRSGNMANALNAAASRAATAASTGDKAADEVRAGEIRRWFAEQDPAFRENRLSEALAQGDFELLNAIIRAPRCLGLASESLRQSVERRLAARIDPTSAATADDLRALANVMNHNFTRARKALAPLEAIARQTAPARFDPVHRVSKGL